MSYLIPISPLESTDNISGIRSIRVIRSADVAQYPFAYDGIAQEIITFLPGRNWITWAATYTTASFSSRSEDSPEGMSGVKELPFVIPKHSTEITRMLSKAERDTFVVLFEDLNGVRWLLGSVDKPVRFAFDLQSGNGRDRNQYTCRFYSDSPSNLIMYPAILNTESETPPTCPSVVIRRGSADGPILAVAPAGSTLIINSAYSFGYQILSS